MPKKINSRQKGARGEREACSELAKYGYKFRRSQQFKGSADSHDIEPIEGEEYPHFPVSIEVKRVERLQLYDALAQAEADSGEGEIPLVMHKKNNCPWVAILTMDDLFNLLAKQ